MDEMTYRHVQLVQSTEQEYDFHVSFWIGIVNGWFSFRDLHLYGPSCMMPPVT